uniref:Uncharacterized protein n=1 Tax=Panagrolaimus davidi TaxID=227884 RepID=A0A914QZS9_9BILA
MNASALSISSSAITPLKHGRIQWPDCPSKKQDWLLPESMIYYMAKNPSSAKCYQKLIQSCKYFFEKNPVLIVANIEIWKDRVSSLICSNEFNECKNMIEKCCIKIDISKLSSKIWLIRDLDIISDIEDYISMLCSKLFRCEINYFGIMGMFVKFEDFKFMASTAKKITLWDNKINFNDGKSVKLDEILECLLNVEEFDFVFGYNTSLVNASTMANIMKLKNFGNLKAFKLTFIPESLNLNDLSDFLKKYKDTKIWLVFEYDISQGYKDELDELIDEIIEDGIPDRVITYEGQDVEKERYMKSRYNF